MVLLFSGGIIVDLINNRYRVLKSVKQNKLVSSYLVTDMKTGSEPMQLNIINKEYIPEKLLDFYIKEFRTLTTIDNNSIVKLYRFGTINFIDNKKIDNSQYFYLSENVEGSADFIQLIKELKVDEILDLFIRLCQSINYLHLRGFVYGDINISNIFALGSKIKIKDIATVALEKYDYWTQKDSQIIFRAPEILAGGDATISSDIYSLGVLLLFMVKKEINENLRMASELTKLKKAKAAMGEDYSLFLGRIVSVIEKMTEQNPVNRYEDITRIVEDINVIFNKNYKAHYNNELERLNFKTKLVGRDYEVSRVLNIYSSKQLKESFICFHGETGIGKTRLLRELQYLLSMKNAKIYSSFTLEDSKTSRNKGFYEILKKLIAECDEDVLERYETELSKLIPELAERKHLALEMPISEEKEKLHLINSICGFVGECLKGKSTVFIIDNLHLATELCINILEHIHLRLKNTIIIFSYCDGELSNNKRLVEFVAKFNNKEGFIDMPLFALNNEDSIFMIKDILRTKEKLIRFGNGIFSKTYGNPQFTEETIKKLFSEKVIYIDEKTGLWNSGYYDYSKLPIPSNMEQTVLSQINDLDVISSELLKVISLFNSGIPAEDLSDMINCTAEETMESVNMLEVRGVLVRKIEDRGFIYDFFNRILKNLVKNKLDSNYEKEKHKIAAKLLERLYESGIENKEELIYHLEKAGEYDKAIKYCLENADNMERLKSKDEAIKNILRAYSMLQPSEKLMKFKLLFRLGNIYDAIGNTASAVKYLEEAQLIAESLEEAEQHVEVLIKLANVHFKKNEIDKTLRYIKICERLLYRADFMGKYIKGYLKCKEVQARVYLIKQDYNRVKEISIRGIELCGEEFLKLKGLFYKNLGNAYIETGKAEKALECYEKSLNCFEKRSYHEGIVMALNNISVIHGDYYQDNEKGISYMLKMKDISERNHIVVYELMALTNLAAYYYDDFAYELALDYLLEALEKSKKIEYESNVFYCYNYLSNVHLKLGNHKEAYEYHKLAEKELLDYPEQGKDIAVYYYMSADLFYKFGDYERAKTYVNKALGIYGADESMQKWDSIILLQYIELNSKEKGKDVGSIIEAIKNTNSNYQSPLKKLNTMYDTITLLYEKGFGTEALKLFTDLKEIEFADKPNILKLKELYVNGVFAKSASGLKYLNSAFDMVKLLRHKALHLKICCALGKIYFSKKDYFYAVNYYFEACEIVKDIAMAIPDAMAIKFVNSPGIMEAFNVLVAIRSGSSSREEKLSVKDKATLMELFDFKQFENILTNKHFIKSAHRIYNTSLPKEVRNVKGIIENLYSDPVKNLDIISKYLASVTLATKSLIIIEDYEQNYHTIAASDGSTQIPSNKFIFERVREVKEALLITEPELLPQGIKAVICIPVIMNYSNLSEDNRHDYYRDYNINSIKGYIYLETDRILNNFNLEGLKRCIELSRLTGSIIERYQLMISSSIDKLTGMLTRKFLEDALNEHIDRADKFDSKFSIIMLDLDHFKHINDRFGHQTGDEVLKKACQIIRNNMRKDDICGRYGGEEFVIILPGIDSSEAILIADRLRLAIEKAQILGGKTPVTVSMGIACYPRDAQWKQELIEKADQALYVSKELGRNRCEAWNNKFSNKSKPTNKLIGIISGNTVEDSRKVLAMLDIIELIKQDIKTEDKIFSLLGRIIEMTEAEYGMLFILENGEIKENYSRKIFEETWANTHNYNEDIVKTVINKKQGAYMTDWDGQVSFDSITGRPDWHSIIAAPLIKNGEAKAVLYLTVSTKIKEFKFEEFNFVNTLGELAVGIL